MFRLIFSAVFAQETIAQQTEPFGSTLSVLTLRRSAHISVGRTENVTTQARRDKHRAGISCVSSVSSLQFNQIFFGLPAYHREVR